MDVKIAKRKDRLVASLSGELNNMASFEAKKALGPLMEQTDLDVEVDCSGLEYISSSGLRLFIDIYKHQHKIGRRCFMSHLRENVKTVLELGGFFMLFEQED